MPKTIRAALLAPALLAGCTHVSTLPDTVRTENPDHALRGVAYSLPMLQYDVALKRSLARCPGALKLDFGDGDSIEVSDAVLAFATAAEAKPRYVPGEQYVVNYDSLTSMFKTTGFAIEPYSSGALKTINITADDKSGEIVKDLIKVGLTVAGAVAGGPAGAAIGAAVQAQPVSASAALSGRSAAQAREARRASRRSAIEALEARVEQRQIVGCTDEAATKLGKIKTNSDDQQTLAGELPAKSKEVERLAMVAHLRAANHDDAVAFSAALGALNAALIKAEELTEEGVRLETATSVETSHAWPRLPSDRSKGDVLADGDAGKLVRLLEVKRVRTLSSEAFEAWLAGEGAPLEKALRERKSNEAFFDHFDALKEARQRGLRTSLASSCAEGVLSVADCVRDSTVARMDLQPAPIGFPDCEPSDEEVRCVRRVGIDAGQKVVRDAVDRVVDRGIFVRPPIEGLFTLCRARPAATAGGQPTCLDGQPLIRQPNASVPQLGQLRFLPFRSRPFESAELSLHLREDGSIEKLEYKRPRPMGAGLAAAAGDAAGQYRTYVETRRADRKAAREEEIAKLQHELDLAEKTKALLKAQAPASETEEEALTKEIAKIELRTKYLEAQIAQKKAEAAAAEAGIVQLSAG